MSLKLTWEWVESPYSDINPQHWHPSFAELEIWVNQACVTQNYGQHQQSMQESTLLPLYELAEWLSLHWWHLFHETNFQHEDYDRRHQLTFAGGGFPLPALQLWPVGDNIRLKATPYEPVGTTLNFFKSTKTWLPKAEVEAELTRFIQAVVERLNEAGFTETPLHHYWHHMQELTAEEENFMVAAAHLGRHPEDLEDAAAESMLLLSEQIGYFAAIEFFEVADASKLQQDAAKLSNTLGNLSLEARQPLQADWLKQLKQDLHSEHKPWERGYRLARAVQKHLFKRPETGEDALQKLTGALKIQDETLDVDDFPSSVDGISATEQDGPLHFFFAKRHPASSKFHRGRLLGEYLLNGHAAVHLATRSYLPSQQANRAFAAEILLPEEHLRAQLLPGKAFLEEQQVEEIAFEHQISDQMVRLHAFNKNLLPRPHEPAGSDLEFWGQY